MTTSARRLERTVRLLTDDVAATVGEAHASTVRHYAKQVRMQGQLSADDAVTYLVEQVQQEFHDTFVDTSWPECPRHGKHPLWFHIGAWWCERDAVAVADLGGLAALRNGGSDG